MQQTTLSALVRNETGSAATRRLRRAGSVPAIVYGHKQGPVSLLVRREDALHVFAHRIKMVMLDVAGKTDLVLVKDVQLDTFGDEVLHLDFERIAMDEFIEVECPAQFTGTAKGVAAGGVIEHPVSDLRIRCLPANIPESIKVSVSELEIGDSIKVADMKPPDGVTILTDPDAVLVMIRAPAKVEEVAPAAAVPEGAADEPEVIRRPKAEEEEEEGAKDAG